MEHLAIMKKGYIEKILSGEKKIESRFSINKITPFNRIFTGDKVYMQETGQQVTAMFEVGKVLFFENLSESKIKEIYARYGKDICAEPEFWNIKKHSKYATLIYINAPQRITPFKVNKSDRSAFKTVVNVKQELMIKRSNDCDSNNTEELRMSYNKAKEEIRKELQCKIYTLNSLITYKYVVICTYYHGKIVLSRHKLRDTWETQGGHIEEGETPLAAAKRELYEESGISDADIYPVCDYYGYNSKSHSNGMVFLALVHSLNNLPPFEMKEISFFDELPSNLTYPDVTPVLFNETKKYYSQIENQR